MALRVGWAGNIILLGAVMALSIWVFQGPCSNGPGTAGSCRSVSDLRQSLCSSPESSSAAGAGCQLCPQAWLLHRDRCYWFSKESKNWSESRADCWARHSQMLMVPEPHERAFLRNVTEGKYPVWIGRLSGALEGSWPRVDGSLFNQTGVSPLASGPGNSCEVWKPNRVDLEMCSGVVKWVCQREAVQL
ncbi:killer cell lectin-like receptor subfamily F member 1 [Carettochelys insculpta]|uniref:killer cell lectin-like receptor subfamily F member 1 n=1 Tax=Carettochelys insculpta TaxID=44489 RepID=UPI003EBFEAC1